METSDVNIKNWKSLIKPHKLDVKLSDDKTYAKIIAEPLEKGYGLTLGNSLRTPDSRHTPSRLVPSHCGQSSAKTEKPSTWASTTKKKQFHIFHRFNLNYLIQIF